MKKFLKFLFKGLINNEEVIYGSKHHPWVAAIIIAVLSIILGVVPSFTQIAQTKGAALLTSGQNASLDTSLLLLSEHLEEKNIHFSIDEEGKVDVKSMIPEYNAETNKYYEHVITSKDKELLVFNICHDTDATNFAKIYSEGKEGEPIEKPRSYFIVTETRVIITTYLKTEEVKNTIEEGIITSKASPSYSFVGLNESAKGTNVNEFFATKDYDVCLKNWETFLNDLYKISKTQYLWGYSGVLAGINLGVMLLVAVLTMILTRLKSATGDRLNYIESLKIVCFSALAPGLISLLLGFLIGSFAQVGFVLCLGLRTTFLGMKAANPTNSK